MSMFTGHHPSWQGCTEAGCGTQDTATVDGVHGRRCVAHPPAFVPERAVQLAVSVSPEAAAAYCRTDLP